MEKHMLQAIGKSLLEAGKCPYDSSCPYGRGACCVAPPDQLEQRLKDITERINATPNCFASEIIIDSSPWQCENILTIRLVDPTEENDEI